MKQPTIKAEPKYQEIAGQIRRQIKSGALRGGDRISTVADYCSLFKVSATAVDRAFFLLDQEGLITRQKGRGIYVAQTVQTKGPTIACVGFKLDDMITIPFARHLLKGVQMAKDRYGLDVMIAGHQGPADWNKVQGAIIHSVDVDVLLSAKPANVPAVAVMITTSKAPSVGVDDFEGARTAANHLIDLGHRRIAYMVSPVGQQNRRRMSGFRSAMLDAGIEIDPRWIRAIAYDDTPFAELGRLSMRQFLDDNWEELGCTAIMGQNDLLAIGVMQTLQAEGIRVPDDVSVIGYDDTDECLLTTPPLSTIQVPLESIGVAAVDMLMRQVNGRTVPSATLVFSASLIARGSTGPISHDYRNQ